MTDSLLGKRLLVDIQEFDRSMNLRCTRNFVGYITDASEHAIEIRRDDTGQAELLVTDPEYLQVAQPGDYWLRTTGQGVAQPDLLARWIHYDEMHVKTLPISFD